MTPNPFALRAFEALDVDGKGYLIKSEIYQMIVINGLCEHSLLKDLLKFLDSKFDT